MTTQARGRYRAHRSPLHWSVLVAAALSWAVILGTPALVWSVLP